jgi:hypothetical protein
MVSAETGASRPPVPAAAVKPASMRSYPGSDPPCTELVSVAMVWASCSPWRSSVVVTDAPGFAFSNAGMIPSSQRALTLVSPEMKTRAVPEASVTAWFWAWAWACVLVVGAQPASATAADAAAARARRERRGITGRVSFC